VTVGNAKICFPLLRVKVFCVHENPFCVFCWSLSLTARAATISGARNLFRFDAQQFRAGMLVCSMRDRNLTRRSRSACSVCRSRQNELKVRYAEGWNYSVRPRVGKWKIVNGTAHHPNGIIYELEAASGHGAIRLFKADDNIMLFVGHDGRLMVGNADFSYTLNRADEKFSGN